MQPLVFATSLVLGKKEFIFLAAIQRSGAGFRRSDSSTALDVSYTLDSRLRGNDGILGLSRLSQHPSIPRFCVAKVERSEIVCRGVVYSPSCERSTRKKSL